VSYLQRLEAADNLLCLGLDPVSARMPHGFEGIEGAEKFLTILLEEALSSGTLPSTLKPNLAYFEQYGWRGWKLLEFLVKRWGKECLIVLDAKRGDIGRSSQAYAKAMFEGLGGDSVTLHPWMGPDSVAPFLEFAPEKGAYLLLRTSNPGGDVLQSGAWQKLFQNLEVWDKTSSLGFVVGATKPEELEWVLAKNTTGRPLLIPGVGAQGATAKDVMTALRAHSHPTRHRVNVSSGILYAHEKPGGSFPDSNLESLFQYSVELKL
jgi:orotidine-5'-phosphate decarboxylase